MLYSENELVITDTNYKETAVAHKDEDGQRKKGCIKRDWVKYPQGCYKFPTDHPDKAKRGKPAEIGMHAVTDLPTINAADWPAMIAQLEAEKSRISDFRMSKGPQGGMIPARDQNGKGYCWAHSGVSANLMLRAIYDMPYVDLSAYAIACIIKSYADEGGWGAEGLAFQMARGCPSSAFWAQQSMARANDKPETWENAALHKITEGFIDLGSPDYDRSMTFAQLITCLLCRIPVIVDFNWWSHSVCAIDAVNGATQWKKTRSKASGKLMTRAEFDLHWGMNDPVTLGIAIRILNSWGNTWSDNGTGVLTGQKAVPNGATAPRVTSFSLT